MKEIAPHHPLVPSGWNDNGWLQKHLAKGYKLYADPDRPDAVILGHPSGSVAYSYDPHFVPLSPIAHGHSREQSQLKTPPEREVLRDALMSYFRPDGGSLLCSAFDRSFAMGTAFLCGYATIWNYPTCLRSDGARIAFPRGAFANILSLGVDIEARVEHNGSTVPIASLHQGDLALVEDRHGLAVFVPIRNYFATMTGDAIAAGKLGQMSLSYTGTAEVVNGCRTIDEATNLREVSFCRAGANSATACFAFFHRKTAASAGNASAFESMFHQER